MWLNAMVIYALLIGLIFLIFGEIDYGTYTTKKISPMKMLVAFLVSGIIFIFVGVPIIGVFTVLNYLF